MLNRQPIGVLKPGSIKDVQQAVRYATTHGVKVAIRGRGQSRYGQTLVAKGIVIDSEPLSAIGNISVDTIDTQPGAALESVLRTALDKGYTLPVTTSEARRRRRRRRQVVEGRVRSRRRSQAQSARRTHQRRKRTIWKRQRHHQQHVHRPNTRPSSMPRRTRRMTAATAPTK